MERGRRPDPMKETQYGDWRIPPEAASLEDAATSEILRAQREKERVAAERLREEGPAGRINRALDEERRALAQTEARLEALQRNVKDAKNVTINFLPNESIAQAVARVAEELKKNLAPAENEVLGHRLRVQALEDGLAAVARGEEPPADLEETLALAEGKA